MKTPASSEDYQGGKTSGSVIIKDGAESATFDVTVSDDDLVEDTETFDVNIAVDDTQV